VVETPGPVAMVLMVETPGPVAMVVMVETPGPVAMVVMVAAAEVAAVRLVAGAATGRSGGPVWVVASSSARPPGADWPVVAQAD
jgi:hypothetical protein